MPSINSIAQLKAKAKEYTWELYMFNESGIPTQPMLKHKFLNVIRKVEHTQSNSLRFEGGSWLDWPKASATTFSEYLYDKEDVIMTIKEPGFPVLSYHLRLIKP